MGRSETGARAALPIWLEFMQSALAGMPVENFPNVEPLEKIALTKEVHVDTPDSAPTEGSEEIGGGVRLRRSRQPLRWSLRLPLRQSLRRRLLKGRRRTRRPPPPRNRLRALKANKSLRRRGKSQIRMAFGDPLA